MREATIAGYLICLAGAIVLALLPLRRGSRFANIFVLLDNVLAGRAARVTLVVFWWWIGWHFVVAQTVDAPLG